MGGLRICNRIERILHLDIATLRLRGNPLVRLLTKLLNLGLAQTWGRVQNFKIGLHLIFIMPVPVLVMGSRNSIDFHLLLDFLVDLLPIFRANVLIMRLCVVLLELYIQF